jgi:hypothetical protein
VDYEGKAERKGSMKEEQDKNQGKKKSNRNRIKTKM